MKNNDSVKQQVRDLWQNSNLTVSQISQINFQNDLSLKRVRNIIYSSAKHNRTDNPFYRKFLFTFLATHSTGKSIFAVYQNQPPVRLSKSTIFRTIKTVESGKLKVEN